MRMASRMLVFLFIKIFISASSFFSHKYALYTRTLLLYCFSLLLPKVFFLTFCVYAYAREAIILHLLLKPKANEALLSKTIGVIHIGFFSKIKKKFKETLKQCTNVCENEQQRLWYNIIIIIIQLPSY